MTVTRARLAPLAWGMLLLLACSWGAHAAPGITATQSDALQVDVNTNAVVNPGDTIRYTIRIANTGDTAAASVALEQFLDANTMLVAGSLRTSPLARDDFYYTEPGVTLTNTAPGVLANDSDADGDVPQVQTLSPITDQGVTVGLTANGAFTYAPPPAYTGLDAFVYMIVDDDGMSNDARVVVNVTTAAPPPVTVGDLYASLGNVGIDVPPAAGVLANDTGSGISVIAFVDPSVNNGDVSVAADGSFTYTPDPGFTGTDTFGYTIQDVATAIAVGTVTVQVSDVVWFVDNQAPPIGDGRITSPFDALSGVSAVGDPDDPGEIIFVYEGDGTRYPGGIALEDNQTLIGEGVALATAAGLTVPPHSRPLPGTGTAPRVAGAPAIALASSNTIRGVAIDTTAGAGITGNSVGSLVVSSVPSVRTDGGVGIDIEDGDLAVTLGSVTVIDSLTDGIRLVNVSGTTSLDTLSIINTNGTGVLLSNAGTFNLNSTTASVYTLAGPALEIDNTIGQTNGAAGWAFNRVTSLSSPRDGVTIASVDQDSLLRNLNIDNPVGDGLAFTNVNAAVTLDRGAIDGNHTDDHGVLLTDITGKTTIRGQNAGNRLSITRVGTTTAFVGGHSGIHMLDSGDLEVRYVSLDDIGNSGDEHGINVESPVTGNRSITVADSRFASIGDTGAVGSGSGIDLEVPALAYTGTLTVNVTDNVFQGNGTDFVTTDTAVNLDFSAGADSTLAADISNNNIDGVRSGINVLIAGACGRGVNGRNEVNISWNNGDDFDNDAINVDITDDVGGVGGSYSRLIVSNNTLNAITSYRNSAHDPDEAIEIEMRGASAHFATVNVDVVNNAISGASNSADERWDGDGITVGTAGNAGLNATVNADIADNTIDFCEDAGILLKADESATVNLRVEGNTLGTTGDGIRLNVEPDPYALRTYFLNNVPGSGGWDLEENAAGTWQLGATNGHVQIGSTLSTPADNVVLRNLLFGEGNSTNDLVFQSGASILIVDESTIPGGN
jgi:uncharacterized repeat protein (TIGR01451 family)